MAKAPAKKAAPVRNKAVAKKAAPVRKKAVAKKAVAKKAAPVRKKAVAKKAVAKKAVVKKVAAKKAAPVRKKAVAKKVAAKQAAPVRKKAATSTLKKVEFSSASIEKPWLETEQNLPVFLKEVQSEVKKEPISTQGYSKKKSRKPAVIGFASIVLLIGVSVISVSSNSSSGVKSGSQKATDVVVEESTVVDAVVEETTPTPTPSPTSTKSAVTTKPMINTLDSFAPREFTSNLVGQEVSFAWIAPAKSESVIGYELSTKKSGFSSWVVISSMTTRQLLVSVDLVSMDLSSQYKIASILENGKMAFNKVVISHPGVVD